MSKTATIHTAYGNSTQLQQSQLESVGLRMLRVQQQNTLFVLGKVLNPQRMRFALWHAYFPLRQQITVWRVSMKNNDNEKTHMQYSCLFHCMKG